jgi:hypothetical protein
MPAANYSISLKESNMKQFKLGFGPMSQEIIKILAKHSEEYDYPLMIIASRNQIDFDSGYVCTTRELISFIKLVMPVRSDKLLLCRDHCGPYFSMKDQGLSVEQAIERCKKTIKTDIELGFDLIHIDVSKIDDPEFKYATELIEFAISLKPDIKLEFGSEDNTGENLEVSIANLDAQLKFLSKYKDNVKFFVTQTGSLVKDDQIGSFNTEKNKQIINLVHNAGFLFKEHNADYFNKNDILLRQQAGVDALNIAPQLGTIETTVLKKLAPVDLWNTFADHVYSKNYWQRWVRDNNVDKDTAVRISAHYCFKGPEYKRMVSAIDYNKFLFELKLNIDDVINMYKMLDKDYDHEEAEFQKKLRQRLAELRQRDPFIYR